MKNYLTETNVTANENNAERNTNTSISDETDTMEYWLSMDDDIESNPVFLEKLSADDIEDCKSSAVKPKKYRNTCSWIEKRDYKKKMIRRFLSINPAMDFSQHGGTWCSPGIYISIGHHDELGFYDPKIYYDFNIYTRIFLSRRGDLRKYHGMIAPIGTCYALGRKDKTIAKIANRKIRYQPIDEDTPLNDSVYKKMYGILVHQIW